MTIARYAESLSFARAFAEFAGTEALRLAATGYRVDLKPDGSQVTTADYEINARFIDQVLTHFPTDGVLGEELSHPATGARTWVIDPLDGTQQFMLGIPMFMVSIALVEDGRPVVGVAFNPSTSECYWATDRGGAYRNGTPIQVSARDGIEMPGTVGGSGDHPHPGGIAADALLRVRLAPPAGITAYRFTWPSVFAGCKVAEGNWDADLYDGSSAHDVAAVAVLVGEAGGNVTDRHGADQRFDRTVDGCILSNGTLHNELVRAWTDATAT